MKRKKVSLMSFLLLVVLSIAALPSFAIARDLPFGEWEFRLSVENAMTSVESILNTTRHPTLAESSDHLYTDKYALAEVLTQTKIQAILDAMEHFGLNNNDSVDNDSSSSSSSSLQKVLSWVHEENKPVSLHFHAENDCVFEKEEERKIKQSEIEETEVSGSGSTSKNTKTFSTQTVYYWNYNLSWKLSLKSGSNEIVLQNVPNYKQTIITSGGSSKNIKKLPPPPIPPGIITHDINWTWLFQMITLQSKNNNNNNKQAINFSIDRFSEEALQTCKTPARNNDIQKALSFAQETYRKTNAISRFFQDQHNALQKHLEVGTTTPNASNFKLDRYGKDIFVPMLPLFENSTVLPMEDFEAFLYRHESDLQTVLDTISQKVATQSHGIYSQNESATAAFLSYHIGILTKQYHDSIMYIETMLKDQLVQAIGKEIDPTDFDNFMKFHTKKIFGSDYAPKPFSYAIRRPNRFPDGRISLESRYGRHDNEPVEALVRHIPGNSTKESTSSSMYIPVSAATNIEIQGDRYLHGWMKHLWQGSNPYDYELVARANQFSSFLIVLGTIGGPDTFIPKDAIILQNKDEVLIPILANVLPSAKEFKDAIVSLSPEQQEFAKAFRAMQLESSLFGVCVIQIKPQLEKLLNLPDGALTKEIQLTQDLMSLFVDYQIPSDLLSFDDGMSNDVDLQTKIDAVKSHVKAVNDVIEAAKQKQLEEETKKAEMRKQSNQYAVPPSSSPTAMPSASPSGISSSSEWSSNSHVRSRLLMSAMSLEASSEVLFDDGPRQSLQQQQQQQRKQKQQDKFSSTKEAKTTSTTTKGEDFTLIPKILDEKLEQMGDTSLKSTILKTGTDWERKRQENLLLSMKHEYLDSHEIDSEKKKAFDLLDAISRSGALPIASSELHIIVAVSHCFEKDIMDTIIQDNVNPIEKVENSLMIVASMIHDQPVPKLIEGGSVLLDANRFVEGGRV